LLKMKNKITFSFGRNWVDYVNNSLGEEEINIARNSLLKYLPENEYANKVFIDIGCGSGIFSLNALRLGCKQVISFDVDKYSIEATRLTKRKFSSLVPKNCQWDIFEGSVLDKSLIERLKNKADIAYSWGVLHHTGNMYQAIRNAAQLVKPNGYFVLAIYNRAPSSDYWLEVKKFYNSAPVIIKKLMVYVTFSYIVLHRLLSILKRKILGQPKISLFPKDRGMSIFYDVIDWLGGYPYEYATFEEMKNFVEKLGFKLVKAPTKIPSPKKTLFNRTTLNFIGNNQFVFKKY